MTADHDIHDIDQIVGYDDLRLWGNSARTATIYLDSPTTVTQDLTAQSGIVLGGVRRTTWPTGVDLQGWSFANDYFYDDGEEVIRASDEWLRLNQAGNFINGVYSPGKIRADGGLYVSDDERIYRCNEDYVCTDDNFMVTGGGWLRVDGSEGLYFQSYGGGWHMTDSTWIRSYGNKDVYINKGLRADTGISSGNYSLVAGEVRANLFRGGNSGYYVNPAGTSNINRINTFYMTADHDIHDIDQIMGSNDLRLGGDSDFTGEVDLYSDLYINAAGDVSIPNGSLTVTQDFTAQSGIVLGGVRRTTWPEAAAGWWEANDGDIYNTNTGNVGIGEISPDLNYKLTTSGGGVKAENSSADQPAGYFSNAGGGPALQTGTGDILLGGNLTVGGAEGKLTVKIIDPIFEIDGEKYATYVADFAGGLRTETSGVVKLENGKYVINFDNLEKGSDLWLFWQTSSKNLSDVAVLLTPSFEGKVWYEKNGNILTIYGGKTGEVSYRLSAPRIDHEEWGTLAEDQNLKGIIVSNY